MKPCTGTTYCPEENIKHLHNHLQQMKQPDCVQLSSNLAFGRFTDSKIGHGIDQ
jgi:hypothetical protein